MDNTLFKYIFFAFILQTSLISCQKDLVNISGKTYATVAWRKGDTVPVKNARVKLIFKDTILYQLTPDDGHFSFDIPNSRSTATLHVETGKSTSSKEKYQCIFTSPGLSSAFEIDLSKNKSVRHDIQLWPNELSHCLPRLATFFFDNQSTIPSTAIAMDTLSTDTAINEIYYILKDFPKMKIRIEGHADKGEREKLTLSAARAQYFYDKLINLGISKDQLIPLAYEDKKPFPFIEKSFESTDFAYTEDKKILAKRNQRTSFDIVDWGFD